MKQGYDRFSLDYRKEILGGDGEPIVRTADNISANDVYDLMACYKRFRTYIYY